MKIIFPYYPAIIEVETMMTLKNSDRETFYNQV